MASSLVRMVHSFFSLFFDICGGVIQMFQKKNHLDLKGERGSNIMANVIGNYKGVQNFSLPKMFLAKKSKQF